MKSKRKQLLISSMVMLLVAMLAVTSTTFAWFSSGSDGHVSSFEFTADDASGINLSVDAESWKSTITATDIATQVTKEYNQTDKAQSGSKFTGETTKFVPLSTTNDSVKNGELTFYNISPVDDKLATAEETTSTYYVFNLYVDNLSADAKALVLTGGTVTFKDTDSKTQYAARIGFIDEGNVNKQQSGKNADAIKAEVIALKGGSVAKIYEPNAGNHTDFAKTYLGASENTQYEYNGVKAVNATGYSVTNGFINAVANEVVPVTTFTGNTTEVLALEGNSISKLKVYVWIEGQDIDCTNAIASGKVSVKLDFQAYNKYTLTYTVASADKASFTNKVVTLYDGQETTVDFSKIVNDAGDKVLVGWKLDDTKTYAYNDKIKISKNTTLTAVFGTPFTITYNAGKYGETPITGATMPSNITNAQAGEVITLDTASKAGYDFKGWSLTEDGTAIGTTYTVTESKTLYAIWQEVVTPEP